MIVDIEFFTMKLGKIDGFGDAGDALTSIAKSKIVEQSPEPAKTVCEEEASEEDKSEESDASGKPAKEEKEKPQDSV